MRVRQGPGEVGAAMGDPMFGEQLDELLRAQVRPVDGEDFVDGHVVGTEPVLGAVAESAQRVGILLVECLD